MNVLEPQPERQPTESQQEAPTNGAQENAPTAEADSSDAPSNGGTVIMSKLPANFQDWERLEHLVFLLDRSSRRRKGTKLSGEQVTTFCRMYRNLCGDLSLATSKQLSEPVIQYLHGLAARSHSQLYRFLAEPLRVGPSTRAFILRAVPHRIIRDRAVHIALAAFFLPLLLFAYAAYVDEEVPLTILGQGMMMQLETMYGSPATGRELPMNVAMSGFYVRNNATIALQCFAMGLFLGIGSVLSLIVNGVFLGTVFGFMLSGPFAGNFLAFVVSHTPFELGGIAVSGAAGVKLGYSIVFTNGRSRLASLRLAARDSVPTVCLATTMILMAAAIEGFWSPSSVPLPFKYGMCVLCTAILIVYFGVLGQEEDDGT